MSEGVVANPVETAQMIRAALSLLSGENSHHSFEHGNAPRSGGL